MIKQKQRSLGYVRLKLKERKTWHDPPDNTSTKNATKEPSEKKIQRGPPESYDGITKDLNSKPLDENGLESPTMKPNKPPEIISDTNDEIDEDYNRSNIETKPKRDMVKCGQCEYTFEKARADIDRTILAVHFEIKHPTRKRGFRKLMYKMRKIGPSITPL